MTTEVASRAELLRLGMSRRQVREAVAQGVLIRARRDHYMPADTAASLIEAVRVGGRLTCLSLLQLMGVFVFASASVHVHITRGASRLRSPHDARQPIGQRHLRSARLHWHPLTRASDASPSRVHVIDALICAIRCQEPRHSIATLDSAVHQRIIEIADLVEVFAALPAKYAILRPLVDGRAESGTETLMRLILRSMGCRVRLQVRIVGVGRVDLLVDDWLVVECDSREFHSDWRQQRKDLQRDLALAALGFTRLRVTAEDILLHPELVRAAIAGLLDARRAASGAR